MAIDAESLYIQLGQLVAEMPQLGGNGSITPEINRWLGRACHLVRAAGSTYDGVAITSASDNLNTFLRDQNAQAIASIVYRALAMAEAKAPIAARGGFVGAGAALDALQVVGKLLAEAKKDALIVDPYMDSKVLTDFAPMAASGVSIRLLSDAFYSKASVLLPAVERWGKQFAGRPLDVRLSAPRALHDRLIIADGTMVWSLTQSLKNFASRSPALAQRVDPDIAAKKLEFYEQIWSTATPVT